MYEQEIIEDFSPQKELTKVNFLICFIEQLFKDNKHLLDNSKELIYPYLNLEHKYDIFNEIIDKYKLEPSNHLVDLLYEAIVFEKNK